MLSLNQRKTGVEFGRFRYLSNAIQFLFDWLLGQLSPLLNRRFQQEKSPANDNPVASGVVVVWNNHKLLPMGLHAPTLGNQNTIYSVFLLRIRLLSDRTSQQESCRRTDVAQSRCLWSLDGPDEPFKKPERTKISAAYTLEDRFFLLHRRCPHICTHLSL